MKLGGKLKENVAKAENKEQANETIKRAGMELTDEEMDQVAGGSAYKAVNSALTELDEEGIDIGGDYILRWTGGKWGSP